MRRKCYKNFSNIFDLFSLHTSSTLRSPADLQRKVFSFLSLFICLFCFSLLIIVKVHLPVSKLFLFSITRWLQNKFVAITEVKSYHYLLSRFLKYFLKHLLEKKTFIQETWIQEKNSSATDECRVTSGKQNFESSQLELSKKIQYVRLGVKSDKQLQQVFNFLSLTFFVFSTNSFFFDPLCFIITHVLYLRIAWLLVCLRQKPAII